MKNSNLFFDSCSAHQNSSLQTGRYSLVTQDSGVDEALEESDQSNRGHLSSRTQPPDQAKRGEGTQRSPLHKSTPRARPQPAPKPKLRSSFKSRIFDGKSIHRERFQMIISGGVSHLRFTT